MYKRWLYDRVEFGDSTEVYSGLLQLLFDTNFRYILDMDSNRAVDGQQLRWLFSEDTGYCSYEEIDILMGSECRVLEMLIGMASKVANEVIGETYKGDRTPDWFWRFIRNLGLDSCYGEYLPIEFRAGAVKKLNIWMDRKFDYDGFGSIFPLKNPPGDEREVDIMYQMYAYVHENFPV